MTAYILRLFFLLSFSLGLFACDGAPLNMPYSLDEQDENVLYSAFSEQPKHLDPAKSYSSDEYMFIGQIYEPPLQYHYLKRPYTLVPATVTELPTVQYYDINGQLLALDADPNDIAMSVYDIKIKPDILYQPHPALATDAHNHYYYHHLSKNDLDEISTLNDFKYTGTRTLTAADYVYQIKRLAHPALNSPILSLMQDYIVGLRDYSEKLTQIYYARKEKESSPVYLDLRDYELSGVRVIDDTHYQIRIHGKDPQFLYWLAMPFYAPMPWEADKFYTQAGLSDKNISLDWYPIGTGPFQLTVNNPNKKMVLEKNPNFHGEVYPTEGAPGDLEKGLLQYAEQPLPFIDKMVFSLEKESIPKWSKFLQGYYDYSGISSDNFDQAINMGAGGHISLSDALLDKGINLQTNVSASIYYWGFNMLDETVGGNSESARLLRQAIAIAIDIEEYTSIFLNGRGISAQSPLPPGIFGHLEDEQGVNPYVYAWENNQLKRHAVNKAKALLAKAGYPDGRDATTGEPLIIYYDVISSGGPDDKARLSWMVKQFDKLNIQLQIRATQYSRFREKMNTGHAQLFSWGWNADYPDPENFLFLLYGPNGKVNHSGENAANYHNPTYDALYEKMKDMENTPERTNIINEMLSIVQADSPWIWGFHPMNYILSHQWNSVTKPNVLANNTLKYKRVDIDKRQALRQIWNEGTFWPLGLMGLGFIIGGMPIAVSYWRKEHKVQRERLPKEH